MSLDSSEKATIPKTVVSMLASQRKTVKSWNGGFAEPSLSYLVDESDLWESQGSVLPLWMIKYFRWHKERRAEAFDGTTRFLIVSCLDTYPKCGGFADRLFPLPFFIRVAAQTGRIVLFQWGRPSELEDFLLPPQHGVDWRAPSWLRDEGGYRATSQDVILEVAAKDTPAVVRVKFQAHDHGQVYYDSTIKDGETIFQSVFSTCWNVFFTPVQLLGDKIGDYMSRHGLVQGQYTSIHFRALYSTKERDQRLSEHLAMNAINCGSHLGSRTVFFASDSAEASSIAVEYGTSKGMKLISPQRNENPLHFDKTPDWETRPVTDFFDTLVDFYVLALGHCVLYGMGGYGRMASLLSHNMTCALQHHTATSIGQCSFNDIALSGKDTASEIDLSVFVKAME